MYKGSDAQAVKPLPQLGPDLVEHCIEACPGHSSGVHSNVEVVSRPGANLGESRQYNIDLAPKVPPPTPSSRPLNSRAESLVPHWKNGP